MAKVALRSSNKRAILKEKNIIFCTRIFISSMMVLGHEALKILKMILNFR